MAQEWYPPGTWQTVRLGQGWYHRPAICCSGPVTLLGLSIFTGGSGLRAPEVFAEGWAKGGF